MTYSEDLQKIRDYYGPNSNSNYAICESAQDCLSAYLANYYRVFSDRTSAGDGLTNPLDIVKFFGVKRL